ncbi:hypothetical protein JFV29_21635 [Peribacillus sp. TH16]|nr:hypothetical protein [Peribacillus sp. TH16]
MKQSMGLLLHSRFFPINPFLTLVSTTVLYNFSGGNPVVEKDFLALNYSFSYYDKIKRMEPFVVTRGREIKKSAVISHFHQE